MLKIEVFWDGRVDFKNEVLWNGTTVLKIEIF